MRLIILAAGTGSRLAPLTDDRPKCLVPVAGRPLLEWQLDAAAEVGVERVVVVGGYRSEQIEKYPVTLEVNGRYAETNMVRTLFHARVHFGDHFVMSYGDIAFAPSVLRAVIEHRAPVSVVIDREWRQYWQQRFDDPLEDAETLRLDPEGRLLEIGQKPRSLDDIEAQYIGLVGFHGAGVVALIETYEDAQREQAAGARPFGGTRSLDRLYMTDLLQAMIQRRHTLQSRPITGGWIQVDSPSDLSVGERLIKEGRLERSPRSAVV